MNSSKYVPGIITVGLIVIVTFFQTSKSTEEIRKNTLLYGRDVITNGEIIFPSDDPKRDGSGHNVHDGDPESAAVIPYPGAPPEGTFILLDAGLSHFPAENGGPQRKRLPLYITLFNGPCTDCKRNDFTATARIKKMRAEFLRRQANDPDVDFYFPETKPVYTVVLDVPDRPGPFKIPVNVNPPEESERYPENTFYYRIKITVLDIHSGTLFNDRVSVAEIEYTDQDMDTGITKVWK